jgi:hypothetical protein
MCADSGKLLCSRLASSRERKTRTLYTPHFPGAQEIFNIFGATRSFIYLKWNYNYKGNRSEGNAESSGPPLTKPKLPNSLKFTPRKGKQVRPHNIRNFYHRIGKTKRPERLEPFNPSLPSPSFSAFKNFSMGGVLLAN